MGIPRKSPVIDNVETEEMNLPHIQLLHCSHVTNNQQSDLVRKHYSYHFPCSVCDQLGFVNSDGLCWLPFVNVSIYFPTTWRYIYNGTVSRNWYFSKVGFNRWCPFLSSVLMVGDGWILICAMSRYSNFSIYNNP